MGCGSPSPLQIVCGSHLRLRAVGNLIPTQRDSLSRTLMRTPVVKRQTLPKSGFCQFFPLWLSQAQSVPGNVFRLHFRRLVHQRRCTKHLLRFSRHGNDECSDRSEWSLRPRNISVPSYRPMQREGSTATVCQLVPGSGEGQHTSTRHGYRHLYQSRSGCPIKAKGSGSTAYVLLCVRDAGHAS
jgi:hypothetical protein